jgi:hypothetical protein
MPWEATSKAIGQGCTSPPVLISHPHVLEARHRSTGFSVFSPFYASILFWNENVYAMVYWKYLTSFSIL